jgi:hypothetical protein
VAVQALIRSIAYIGGHDFSCDANMVSLAATGDVLDVTTFCDSRAPPPCPGVGLLQVKPLSLQDKFPKR